MKIYLAVPYSDPSADVRLERFEKVTRKVGELMMQGHIIYSPITSCHPIAIRCGLPTDWGYWEKLDRSFIDWADQVWVYMLDGWKESIGVTAEIKIAEQTDKPVRYIEQ